MSLKRKMQRTCAKSFEKPESNGGEPHTQNVVGKLPKMREESSSQRGKRRMEKAKASVISSSVPQTLNGRPFPQLLLHWPLNLMTANDERLEKT